MAKILVCGSRNFGCYKTVDRYLQKYVRDGDTVIQGGADGADK